MLALLREAEQLMVFTKARERRALEAFALDAQHVHHIELGQHLVELRRHMVGAQNVGARRQKRRRRDDGDLGSP